jgi:hypothetical protein
MDPNALYWLHSTIAQTLSAAFGFLGSFALFRLQEVNQTLGRATKKFAEIIGNKPDAGEIYTILMKGRWNLFLYPFDKSKPSIDPPLHDPLTDACNVICEFGPVKLRIVARLKTCLSLTTLSIIWCLVFLPMDEHLSKIAFYAYAVTIMSILLAVVSLWSYGRLIITAFDWHIHFRGQPSLGRLSGELNLWDPDSVRSFIEELGEFFARSWRSCEDSLWRLFIHFRIGWKRWRRHNKHIKHAKH